MVYAYVVSYILYSIAVSVSFNQPTYIVNENDGLLQAVLVLNKSVASNITIQVRTSDNIATGEHTKSIKLITC